MNNNAAGFCLVLSEAYSKSCETANMKGSAKGVNSWMQSVIFVKVFILDALLGSECVSDYPEAFSISIKGSTWNLSRIFPISLVFYLSI